MFDTCIKCSSAIVQAADERNYHVFYELLKGLTEEEMKKYGLKAASQYFYLNQVIEPVQVYPD